MKYLIAFLFILSLNFLFGHEEHQNHEKHQSTEEPKQRNVYSTQDEQVTVKEFSGRPQNWAQWIGGFHFIFLHFPIALITMVAISELLFVRCQKPIFDEASRFMLIAAAILTIPTAVFGLIYSYTASYEGVLADFILWHMWFGIVTAIFAIMAAILREHYGTIKLYYTCLFILFLFVNITGFLGGGVTFGPYHMIPPSF